MPASFNDLAVEIVEEIINILDPPDEVPDRLTLAGLNRTSKSLNALTTWRLYRAPRYRYSNWPLFARTVMARPDLAGLVKDLYFYGTKWDDPLDPEKFPEEVATYYLKHLYPNFSLPLTNDDPDNVETLFTADADGEDKAYVEMDFILSFCWRSVETVFVNLMLCHQAFNLLRIDPPTSLPALKSLCFGYIDAVTGWALDHDLPVTLGLLKAAAPNLTRLEVCRVNTYIELDFVLEKVTELVIRYSAMKPEAFGMLLSLVPNVEKLVYEGGANFADEWDQFDPPEALIQITEHCPKLKSFKMDMSQDMCGEYISNSQLEDMAREFAGRGIEATLIL
ncbi:hypothetical protein QBC43DRAFT_323313 [Cladorrhinum sp. PSN259]|nr:hypothetical protein QBC43DRAFT_323313 [Cladorrhinum sp. PSN259]